MLAATLNHVDLRPRCACVRAPARSEPPTHDAARLRGFVQQGPLAGSRRMRIRYGITSVVRGPVVTVPLYNRGVVCAMFPIGIEGSVTAGRSNNKHRRRQEPCHAMRGHYIEFREPSGSSIGARDRGGNRRRRGCAVDATADQIGILCLEAPEPY